MNALMAKAGEACECRAELELDRSMQNEGRMQNDERKKCGKRRREARESEKHVRSTKGPASSYQVTMKSPRLKLAIGSSGLALVRRRAECTTANDDKKDGIFALVDKQPRCTCTSSLGCLQWLRCPPAPLAFHCPA